MGELETKWPDLYTHTYCGKLSVVHWQADAFDAAMERLRICEAVLQDIRVNAHTLEDAIGYANEALVAIGPLPVDPPTDSKGG
jgi:hypothetical protein